MSAFLQALHSGRVLLMDGAMGTELQRMGMGPDECGESWNVTRAGSVWTVHGSYIDAGSEVLLTNTFQAHPARLARFGLEDCLGEINGNAVRLAHKAAGDSRFVLGDIGPIVNPGDDADVEFLSYKVLGQVLTSFEGVDGFLFETCSSPRALSAVLYAFRHVACLAASGCHNFPPLDVILYSLHHVAEVDVPLLLSLSYRHSPAGQLVTLSGHSPEWFAERAKDYRVTALGVNCGRDIDMDDIIEIIRRYRAVTDLPLFARPNAGTPTKQDDRWIYPQTPEAMAVRLPELLEAGVSMVGGCCGTTPAHIAAFRNVLASLAG